jgi:hypothetical protein
MCEKECWRLGGFLPKTRDLVTRETSWLRYLVIGETAMNFLKIHTLAATRSTVQKVTNLKLSTEALVGRKDSSTHSLPRHLIRISGQLLSRPSYSKGKNSRYQWIEDKMVPELVSKIWSWEESSSADRNRITIRPSSSSRCTHCIDRYQAPQEMETLITF